MNAPAPCRMATPCSRQKARIWQIKRVRAVTRRSRMRCSACRSTCSGDLSSTKRIVGRVTASAMAAASMRSFLFDLTYGLTNWAGTMRTVCPSALILRASHCEPAQASMPTTAGAAASKNCSRVSRRNLTFWTGCPEASRPTTWKTFLPMSTP